MEVIIIQQAIHIWLVIHMFSTEITYLMKGLIILALH